MCAPLQIRLMGTRDRAADTDFSAISLEEEVEAQLKEAAVVSMGTEVSEEDMLNILALCEQVGPGCPRQAKSSQRIVQGRYGAFHR